MSNSIWHNRDETPKDFCDVVLTNFATGSYCVFLSPFHDLSFDYDRWAYLTDIIAQADKAERLQKAVDLAINVLKKIDWCAQDYAKAQEALNKIKQLIKETTNDK